MSFIETDARGGLRLRVKVKPGAPKTRIVGIDADRVVVHVAAPPEKGKANKELVKFLARRLGLDKSMVKVTSGETDRHKTLTISGIDAEECTRRLLG